MKYESCYVYPSRERGKINLSSPLRVVCHWWYWNIFLGDLSWGFWKGLLRRGCIHQTETRGAAPGVQHSHSIVMYLWVSITGHLAFPDTSIRTLITRHTSSSFLLFSLPFEGSTFLNLFIIEHIFNLRKD